MLCVRVSNISGHSFSLLLHVSLISTRFCWLVARHQIKFSFIYCMRKDSAWHNSNPSNTCNFIQIRLPFVRLDCILMHEKTATFEIAFDGGRLI